MPEPKEPSAEIDIHKRIRNAPVSDDELEAVVEVSKKPGNTKKSYDAQETDDDQFPAMLQDEKVQIGVDRVSPREFKGHTMAGMVDEFVPPTTVDEIQNDVKNRFGGGRYRIRITKNGRFIGARGFSIYGDPKLPEDEDEDLEFEVPTGRPMFAPGPTTPLHTDSLSNLRTKIEEERLKAQFEEVKRERENRFKRVEEVEDTIKDREEKIRREYEQKSEMERLRMDMDKKFQDMMQAIGQSLSARKEVDPDHDVRIVQLDNKIERIKTELLGEVKSTFSEVKAALQSLGQQPKQDNTPELFKALIQGFGQMASAGDNKMHAWAEAERAKTQAMMESMRTITEANAKVAQAQTDKLVTVLQSQMERKHDDPLDSMAKTISVVRDMMDNLNPQVAAEAAAAEPADLPTRVVGIIEKALPSIMAANAQSQKQGRQLTDEEIQTLIMQQAEARARQIAPALAAQYIKHQQQQAALPQPRPNGPKAWGEKAGMQQEQQAATPPPSPTPQPQPQQETIPPEHAQEAAPEQPAQEQTENPEEETSLRVNECLKIILKEINIRPRKSEWNEMAYDDLPQDMIDRLVLVTNADELYELVRHYADPELLQKLVEHLRSNEKAVAWFTSGLNEIKEWYVDDSKE